MASPLRPKGPLPTRVYWFRRALVFGVPLVMVVALAQVLANGSDGKDAAPDGEVSVRLAAEQQSEPGAVGPTAPAQGKKGGKGKKKKAPVQGPTAPPEPVLVEPSGDCDASDVVITPSVPAGITGDGLQIDFAVTTRTNPACYWDFSPDSVSVAITSGSDDIWFSRHCPTALPTAQVVARPQTPGVVSMMWNLRRSDAECSRLTEWVRLGYYHVSAAPFGGEPVEVQFQLTRPPAEVVTKTVTPSPDPSGTTSGGRKNKNKGKNKNNQSTEHQQGDDGAGVDEPNG